MTRHLFVAGCAGLVALLASTVSAGATPPMPDLKGGTAHLPVIRIQAQDQAMVQIQQLQEQVRQLNGRIEEMSFQLLQMQETIRKAQEDNEFRFQELEKSGGAKPKKSGALDKPVTPDGAQPQSDLAKAEPAATPSASPVMDGGSVQTMQTAASNPDFPPAPASPVATQGTLGQQTAKSDPNRGAPATTLGQLSVDKNGKPIGATLNDTGAQTAKANTATALPGVSQPIQPAKPAQPAAAANPQVASLGGTEADSYQIAYGHILTGDYAQAEQEFKSFITTYPQSDKAADANFWLGESFYSQGKYNDAAKVFLNAHQTYGKSPKAPEMLLKLGMSLAALDNTETACVTLKEVSKRYPKASRTVINKVASEEKRLGC